MYYFDYTSKLTLLVVWLLTIILISLSYAWSPENGIGICTVSGHQTEPQMVSDGFGGAVIAWVDGRNNGGTTDIYAQRIASYGEKLWAQNGIPICTASSNQQFSNPNITDAIIADGYGNYIITWQDYRNGNWDIYAQKINSQGSTLWALNGITVCTVSTDQVCPSLISDGAGGAIIAWQDVRNNFSYNSSHQDIYVQRIDNNGIPLWTLGGIAICTAEYTQCGQMLISDENHGAIVVWKDYREPFGIPIPPYSEEYNVNPDVYAQRVDNYGNSLWNNNGIRITHNYAERPYQNDPYIIPDGVGGGFISCAHVITLFWPPVVTDILRINSSGSTLWSYEIITTNDLPEGRPVMATDASNGIIAAVYLGSASIYSGRVNNSGTILWPINGVEICTTGVSDNRVLIVSDGTGGAIIAWKSYIYIIGLMAQRINNNGSTLWDSNGITISTTGADNIKMVSDMANGAILAWQDERNGIDTDIYAQRIYGGGYVISPVNVPKELWDVEP